MVTISVQNQSCRAEAVFYSSLESARNYRDIVNYSSSSSHTSDLYNRRAVQSRQRTACQAEDFVDSQSILYGQPVHFVWITS